MVRSGKCANEAPTYELKTVLCLLWRQLRNRWLVFAGDESRGGNRLVAVTERSTIASETVALTFDTSETAVTALRAV